MRLKRWWIVILIAGLALTGRPAGAAQPVVHAVLFYSPTCGHCHQVITVDLPPLIEHYGKRLSIVGIDVTQPAGQQLYLTAQERFDIAPERRGVPTLVIGDVVLVGSMEIPEQLPGLIEQYLAQGGVNWPDIPGLTEVLAAAEQAAAEQAATEEAAPAPEPETAQTAPLNAAPVETRPDPLPVLTTATIDIGANLARDPVANALAIGVLAVMIVSLGRVTLRLRRPIDPARPRRPDWAIPVLCAIGLGVAAYLAYVETAQVAAVCGPIGDCNTVQQSSYARLFGLIPIGLLGVLGYLVIGGAWLVRRAASGRTAYRAAWMLFGLTALGTIFSIYLTFLEPFIIGATCAWCLTSAVIMTLLLWLSTEAVRLAAPAG